MLTTHGRGYAGACMTKHLLTFIGLGIVFILLFLGGLLLGAGSVSLSDAVRVLSTADPQSFGETVVLYQRLPRALIAIYVGSVTACSGLVFQGVVRNPLASPSTLGVNAGATLFVVIGVFVFGLDISAQGFAALIGAFAGLAVSLFVARIAQGDEAGGGLALILAGALVSMLFMGITSAFLLSNPLQRSELLNWVTGNINHVYVDRLYAFWWIGALSLILLGAIARPLTLVLLGREKAESAGVNVSLTTRSALIAAVAASGSAVAICGPIGFIGLIVPHILRPVLGSGLSYLLPASAILGACICLLADIGARLALQPYVIHTSVIMDLIGGVVFVVIVKRYYLSSSRMRTA